MRVTWSTPALTDLRNIDDWLTRNASADTAVRMLASIRFRARVLEDFPRSGRPHADEQRILRVYRTPCLIRYRVARETVAVIRVHHERENWQLEP